MADNRKDFVKSRLPFLLFWVLPPTAMIAAVSAGPTRGHVTLVWAISLLVMSAGCFLNALRSGRLHCALTGPFFLLMACATLLYGFGVISLAGVGWELIGAITALGGFLLTYLPEKAWGTYLKRKP